MSTSAISSASLYQEIQQYYQTRQSDLKQLGEALQSGDLAGAKAAFNAIVALGKSGPFAGGNPFKINQREGDFNALGQALQSGNLADAQAAFATLQATFDHRRLDPPNGGSGVGPDIIVNLSSGNSGPGKTSDPISANGSEVVVNLGGNSGSSGAEQLTINISNSSNGGEQVSVDFGGKGSNAQQITFNLGANTKEQIVLNLLDQNSSSSASNNAAAKGSLSVSA
jgi:hypothetical protein